MGGRRLLADPGRLPAHRRARSATGSGAGASSRSASAIFTFASFLCGIAEDPTLLNLARGLQGIGAAGMFATSLALIGQEFHGKDRATAFGVWGATSAAPSRSGR